jgi:seryl-tRNA synthetase
MLDAKFIENNPEQVQAALDRRNATDKQLAAFASLGELNDRRRELLLVAEQGRMVRNQLSPQIGQLMKAGERDQAAELKLQVKTAGDSVKEAEALLESLEAQRTGLLLEIPNVLDERVPAGKDEASNELVRTWGTPAELGFEPKSHDVLGQELDILDFERGVKLSGTRFAVYKGLGARLERALINLFLNTHSENHGYTELMVPYMVKASALYGTGQLPKFEADLFKLTTQLGGEDAYLIPTAEVPVTNLHREEILEESELPKAYVAFTPCFRSEAGSYGRDTKGLIRQHQFHKVEMVRISTPQDSDAQHELLTGHAEAILQALGLPYRVMRLCGGDISFNARHCYDLEVWMPGQGAYREISSCSNFGDFQSRRMALRYRPESTDGKKSKPVLAHTINGSGLAVGRTVVAILENYQQPDGSIVIPGALVPYMGVDRIPAGH